MPELIGFYAMIGGNDSGFSYYEKFSHRYNCNRILEKAFLFPELRTSFLALQGSPQMEQFLNSLIGDVTWAYDEALGKLHDMHELDTKKNAGQPLDPKSEADYAAAVSHCRSVLPLGYKGMHLLRDLTGWARKVFYSETFLPRLATQFNLFVASIHGTESEQYQVAAGKDAQFFPEKILRTAVVCFANLSVIFHITRPM